MSKFCTKCGATLDDNATFCTACGAKSEVTASAPAGSTSAAATGSTPLDQIKEKSMQAVKDFQSNPKKNTYIGIGVVAVVAIILIIIIANVVGGGGVGYKSALNNYFDAICDKDGAKYLSATTPDVVIKYMKKEEDMTKSEMEALCKTATKYIYNYLEDDFGKNLKISYKITDKEKIDKDDLEDYEDMYNDSYDDEIKFKIKSGYEVELELTIKGKDDKEDDIEATAVILNINGDWVVEDLDCDDYYALNY